MPRYYFHVCDGKSSRDDDGTDLFDCHAARIAAIKLAGAVVADEAERVASSEGWRIEVTDATGAVIFEMAFSMTEAPVSAGDTRSRS